MCFFSFPSLNVRSEPRFLGGFFAILVVVCAHLDLETAEEKDHLLTKQWVFWEGGFFIKKNNHSAIIWIGVLFSISRVSL